MDFDGNNVESVHYIKEYISPIDCALYEHNLYWADLHSQSIQWVNKSHPSMLQNYGHLSDGVVKGVVVAHESRQPYGKNFVIKQHNTTSFSNNDYSYPRHTFHALRGIPFMLCTNALFFRSFLPAKQTGSTVVFERLVRKAKFLSKLVIKHFNL